MFRKRDETVIEKPSPVTRVTSVLGPGITWKGSLHGSGGVRIEGAFDGEISVQGLLVVSETGRVTCPHIRVKSAVIAGAVQGNITAEKVEIRSTGRVWGDVVTAAFSTEEGAFLRGQIRMEDKVDVPYASETPEPQPEEAKAEEEDAVQPEETSPPTQEA